MVALLAWGAITFTLVDNALRARMVGALAGPAPWQPAPRDPT